MAAVSFETCIPPKKSYKETGEGKLSDVKETLYVVVRTWLDAFQEGLMINHPGILRPLFINVIEERVVYPKHDGTLVHWLEENKMPLVVDYPIPADTWPSASVPDGMVTLVRYIPDKFKEVIKSLLEVHVHLHRLNLCFFSLGLEDLVMVDDQVKVWRLRVQPLTPFLASRDFRNLEALISSLFSGNDLQGRPYIIPEDMRDLLDRMKGFHSGGSEGFLLEHLAILPESDRSSFFESIRTKIIDIEFPVWTQKELELVFTKNALGKKTFFGWDKKVELYRPLYMMFNLKGSFWITGETETQTKTNASKVHHSIAAFIGRSVSRIYKLNEQFETHFLDEQTGAMIIDCFCAYVIGLQENLHDAGLLPYFMNSGRD